MQSTLTKNDAINAAYAQLRISGLTVSPTADDIALALRKLEVMMAEYEKRDICLDYNFEHKPDLLSLTNIEQWAWQMIETNLAIRLVEFDINIPEDLRRQARQSLSLASNVSAAEAMRDNPYPSRMPTGSGNTQRRQRWLRFFPVASQAPATCKTNKMIIDDLDDFVEHFDAFLNKDEIIASVDLTFDRGINVLSNSISGSDINYRVQALDNSTVGAFQQVKIIITTDTGRKLTRFIDFEITGNETVGFIGS